MDSYCHGSAIRFEIAPFADELLLLAGVTRGGVTSAGFSLASVLHLALACRPADAGVTAPGVARTL